MPQPVPVPIWGQPRAASLLREERHGLWLVEGQCVRVDNSDPRLSHSLVKITHNYTGPNELIGEQFKATGPFYTGFQGLPLMEEKSRGIFVVRWYEGGPGWMDVYMGYNFGFFDLPAFEKVKENKTLAQYPEYQELLPYAQFVEQIAKAPRDEQLRLLRSAVKSPNLKCGVWAISTLAGANIVGAAQFLRSLVDETTLPALSQVELERALELLHSKKALEWNATPARLELLQRLVTSAADDGAGQSIVGLLIEIARDEKREVSDAKEANRAYLPPVGTARLSQWLRLASENAQWSQKARQSALSGLDQLNTFNVAP